jgi:hypothetical protein
MLLRVALLLIVACHLLLLCACNRSEAATRSEAVTSHGGVADHPRGSERRADCMGHAACAAEFYLDAAGPQSCAVGSICTVDLQLVAKGEFHVNDQYPYRFSAEEGPGVRLEGKDPTGKNVFSKPAGDWEKTDAKRGVMKVRFTPLEKGSKTIAGTFKLSVCSAETCLLEQRRVSASVVAD